MIPGVAPGPPHLVRTKTRIPALAQVVIARERVVGSLARAADGRRILEVVASAGSGKTTAVVQFLASRDGPGAWLTLGDADGSPGRFVTYLAAALDDLVPSASEDTRERLAAGVLPADCAAMLVEALPAGATVVIDDVHLVEDRPPVLAVLRALAAAVAEDALVILVSRRPVPVDMSRSLLTGDAGRVTGQDLAFTDDEVGALLDAHDVAAEPSQVARSSGGWAAGIVFDALRGGRPASPADDPFFEYLGAEVLRPLTPEVRDAVVRSSVLEIVEPRGLARILDVPSAEAAYREIRRQQLPATIEPEGLRYHPRFREFLLSLLDRDPACRRAVLLRDALRMHEEGHVEEAADRFLEAGALDEAADAVEAAGADRGASAATGRRPAAGATTSARTSCRGGPRCAGCSCARSSPAAATSSPRSPTASSRAASTPGWRRRSRRPPAPPRSAST